MPFTINGIGTGYYGKRNLETWQGQCEFCGRMSVLRNYETWHCICVVFIPVIPLGRKQILQDCSSCRKHRAASAKAWQEITNNSIESGIEELSARPDDPETAVRLLNTYLAFRKFKEATDLAGAIHRRFPRHAGAQIEAAVRFELQSEKPEAEACWRQALVAEPGNIAARRGLALRRIDSKDSADAHRLLRSAPEIPVSQEPGLYLHLGRGFQNEGLHREALAVFREILDAVPRWSRDRHFRKLVQASERAIGSDEPLLPAISLWRSWKFLTAVGVVAAICGGLLLNWYFTEHRTLYVVNGFDVPVTVRLEDGDSVSVPPHDRQTLSISEGHHRARYVIAGQSEQIVEFDIRASFFERFRQGRIDVLNPGGGALLVWEETEYSANPTPRVLPHRLMLGEDFASADAPDYAFQPFPKTLSVSNKKGSVRKTRFDVAGAAPVDVLAAAGEDVSIDARMRYAESHLRAAPDSDELLMAYATLAYLHQQLPRCREFLAGGLAERPVHIDWHRTYQWMDTSDRELEQVRQQYSAMLDKEPGNSALLYLRGRIEADPARALDYYERSIKADPKNPYPLFAKSYQKLTSGDFGAARDAATSACLLAPEHAQMRQHWLLTLFAAGDYEQLERELRQAKEAAPLSLDVHLQLLQCLAAKGAIDATRQAQTDYEQRLLAVGPNENAARAISASQCLCLYLEKQFDKMLARAQSSQGTPEDRVAAFYARLELGQLDEAAALVESAESNLRGQWELCLSIAWRARGKPEVADKWQEKACRTLGKGFDEGRRVAEMLANPAKVDVAAAQNAVLDPSLKAMLLVALAQQSPAHRADLVPLAEKLNFSPIYPHHFIKHTSEQLAHKQP